MGNASKNASAPIENDTMKSIVLFCALLLGILLYPDVASSQRMIGIKPARPIICYQSFENRHDHVGVSDKFRLWRKGAVARVKTATIDVEYINFPPDNLARNALEYAVAIWETELESTVPIRMRAEWRALASGVLGQAIWGSAYANFGGEQHINTFYPVALAEKIAGREINGVDEPDVVASFSSNASWYFGTDGNTPAGKMDMVTIALHEIAHGLGFTDTYDVKEGQGAVGLSSDGRTVPFVFDVFVENKLDKNLLHDFQSPSPALATELQSSNVFFDSPLATGVMQGSKPELYAPSSFDNGSSISHLDESVFNSAQDANRLMTPQIAFAESIHDPGPILMAMLGDIGWVYTLIDHEPLGDNERKDGQPYWIRARIRSDNGYDPASVKLHYTTDGVNYIVVTMSPSGQADEFEYPLPGSTVNKTYGYFISATDNANRTYTNPGKIQASGQAPEQGTHVFSIGTDTQAPQIVHEPVQYIPENSATLVLLAEVTDNLGVKEVVVEYTVNGGPIQTTVMQPGGGNTFNAAIALPAIHAGDEIQYRMIARDLAQSENIARFPDQGFFVVRVTGILPVQDSYSNDFDEPTEDFFGDAFSIETPPAFENGAIHSEHPYENGSGPNSESNYTYQLQIPIRVREDDALIRFDEIVLVEPGSNGSVFGDDDFFDYVVVEGSVDGGVSWKPLASGYDARDNSVWLTRYNQHIVDDNSQAEGDPTLFHTRTIDMLENGNFSEGDEVLIRFRLFADQLAYGWGWAIDNLSIQSPTTAVEDIRTDALKLYPVPATDELNVTLVESSPGSMRVAVSDMQGHELFSQVVESETGIFQLAINVNNFPDGLYVLRAKTANGLYLRKFVCTSP